MEVLPSIDLRGGNVVRLAQGDYDRQTVYGDDPAVVAGDFVAAGARWVHVVDLDAARTGESPNAPALAAIRQAVGADVKIEFGGGLRDLRAIDRMLAFGADRLVIGSAAMKDWPWFEGLLADENYRNERLALGLDARAGWLAAEGWTDQLDVSAVDLARRVTGSGLGAIVYTDIDSDGMLTGPNLDATAGIIQATDVPVVASGGVSGLGDVARCKEIGCAGVIVGRAYYEGRIDLAEACRLARE